MKINERKNFCTFNGFGSIVYYIVMCVFAEQNSKRKTIKMSYLRQPISSYFQHFGPSTSLASQSSLEIIMENSPIESTSQQRAHSSRQSSKNRSEYENLSDGEVDDDGSGHNSEPRGAFGRKSSRGWRNVRAVMAYYYTLRKIKRNVLHKQFIIYKKNSFVLDKICCFRWLLNRTILLPFFLLKLSKSVLMFDLFLLSVDT